MDTIGSRIKKVRTINKMKQKEFAERLFISSPYVSMIESGKEQPTDMLLKLIALDFNVSFSWLKDGNGTMTITKNEYDYFERNNEEIIRSGISDEIQVLNKLLEKNSSPSDIFNTSIILQKLNSILENNINNLSLTTLVYEQIASIIFNSCDFINGLNKKQICPETIGELYKGIKLISDGNHDCMMEIGAIYEKILFPLNS